MFRDNVGTRGVVDAGDLVLRVFDPGMSGAAKITFTRSDNTTKVGYVSFDARGRLATSLSGAGAFRMGARLRYCDKRGATNSVGVIEVSRSGQVRVQNKEELSSDSTVTTNLSCPS